MLKISTIIETKKKKRKVVMKEINKSEETHCCVMIRPPRLLWIVECKRDAHHGTT